MGGQGGLENPHENPLKIHIERQKVLQLQESGYAADVGGHNNETKSYDFNSLSFLVEFLCRKMPLEFKLTCNCQALRVEMWIHIPLCSSFWNYVLFMHLNWVLCVE